MTPCIVPGACGGRPGTSTTRRRRTRCSPTRRSTSSARTRCTCPTRPFPGSRTPRRRPGGQGPARGEPRPPDRDRRHARGRVPHGRRPGSIDGLYLDGIASTVADAGGFLEPLFGDGVRTTPARRATSVSGALDGGGGDHRCRSAGGGLRACQHRDPLERWSSCPSRTRVPCVVPERRRGRARLAARRRPARDRDPGRPAAAGVQPGERAGRAWCGDRPAFDAYRLCGLVFDGLYGFEPGTLVPQPSLARACTPDAKAKVWTCTLRPAVKFSDGKRVDAGDVLATFVAEWDATGPIRSAGDAGAFAAWDELFGGPLAPGG